VRKEGRSGRRMEVLKGLGRQSIIDAVRTRDELRDEDEFVE
jgi:hypothetical protein